MSFFFWLVYLIHIITPRLFWLCGDLLSLIITKMRSTWIKGVVFSVQILWIFGSALIWCFLFPQAHIIPLPQSHRKLIQIENWKPSQLVRINLYTSQSTQSYASLMLLWFLFNSCWYIWLYKGTVQMDLHNLRTLIGIFIMRSYEIICIDWLNSNLTVW